MANLFATILNMSLTASIIIGIVLLARLCLKKAPKIFSYVLWSVVLFRLLCPVSISLPVSVLTPMSDASTSAGTSYTASMEYISLPDRPANENTHQSVPGENIENDNVNESASVTAPKADTSPVIVEQQKISAGEITLAPENRNLNNFVWVFLLILSGVLRLSVKYGLSRFLLSSCCQYYISL